MKTKKIKTGSEFKVTDPIVLAARPLRPSDIVTVTLPGYSALLGAFSTYVFGLIADAELQVT